MRASTRTSKKPAHRAGGVGDAVPRVLGAAQNLGAGAIHLPRAGPIPLAPKAPGKLCFPGDPLPPGLKNPRLHRGFGWRQRVRALPTHRQGPASAGRRGYAATSVLGQRPKTLAQGGFTPPEQVQWAAGHQKKRTSYRTSSFFGASDEARTRPQGPRKAMLSWGPPTSWIEKSAATPRIWVEAASSSLTHASPGTRVSGTAWVRRHKRFGATPQNLGAGRIHSARAGPMGRRSPKKEDVLPDVLFFWSE